MNSTDWYYAQLKENRMNDTDPINDERMQERRRGEQEWRDSHEGRDERRANVLAPKTVEQMGRLLTTISSLSTYLNTRGFGTPVLVLPLSTPGSYQLNLSHEEIEELVWLKLRQAEQELANLGLVLPTAQKVAGG